MRDTRISQSMDKLSPGEISAFCAQMAMVLRAGIPVAEGLSIMVSDAQNTRGKAILQAIYDEVEMGASFHAALASTGKFPDYVVNMAEIGDVTGKLESVMESLSTYYEREMAISRLVRNAVTYPLLMIAMMMTVIILLIVRVLPIFNDVFRGLGVSMTGFSLAVMNFGQVLARYSVIIVSALAVLGVLFWIFSLTEGGRRVLSRVRASFFLTRGVHEKIASGHFASAMALTLSSGLDVDQSLEMAYKLVQTPSVREKIERCRTYMSEGTTFSEALIKVGIFSGLYAGMVSVAFKTGALDSVMEKLAARYEDDVNVQITRIISVVEPSLVIALSVIVGMILLSVMLPLMGIMAVMN